MDLRSDELEQDAVAASEVGDDLVAGELEERQQSPHSRNRMGVVVVDVTLIVDRPQLFFRQTAGADMPLGHPGSFRREPGG